MATPPKDMMKSMLRELMGSVYKTPAGSLLGAQSPLPPMTQAIAVPPHSHQVALAPSMSSLTASEMSRMIQQLQGYVHQHLRTAPLDSLRKMRPEGLRRLKSEAFEKGDWVQVDKFARRLHARHADMVTACEDILDPPQHWAHSDGEQVFIANQYDMYLQHGHSLKAANNRLW